MLHKLHIETNYLQDELFIEKAVSVTVLRLDKIHPVVSGNKLFKLQYLLNEAKKNPEQIVLTFGGAFSNHLVAAAYACQQNELSCIGIVRGEKGHILSHTLQQCLQFGMQLNFISRAEYEKKEDSIIVSELIKNTGECFIIPEGGYHPLGAKGAAVIMDYIDNSTTHIACAVGSATTLAGLLTRANNNQQVIAFPVLRGLTDIEKRLSFLTGKSIPPHQLHIEHGYHFDGYAKKNNELIAFMNHLYQKFQLPTDFVYTSKMMYGILDMIKNNFFSPGSKIVCIHTGGLQGNLSLQKDTLTFS